MTFRIRLIGFALAALLISGAAQAQELTVFAAASLTDAMKDISTAWAAKGHQPLTMSFGSSSTLARQLDQGAHVNVFASADEEWMNWAAERKLIADSTRLDLLSNSLVLVVPADKPIKVDIKPGFDLAALLGPKGRVATGDPAHVPVGRYAAASLKRLGIWDSVANRIAPADSVRSALLLVERGETPIGIVYATDAQSSTKVAIAGTFPADSHEPISYPFAITRSGDTALARDLLGFMASSEGRDIFTKFGFVTE